MNTTDKLMLAWLTLLLLALVGTCSATWVLAVAGPRAPATRPVEPPSFVNDAGFDTRAWWTGAW